MHSFGASVHHIAYNACIIFLAGIRPASILHHTPRLFLPSSVLFVWSGLARWWRLSCLLGSELAPRAVMRSAVDGFWLWDKRGLLPTWRGTGWMREGVFILLWFRF
jgi:hypothetical protein